jgi:hypothetical protein
MYNEHPPEVDWRLEYNICHKDLTAVRKISHDRKKEIDTLKLQRDELLQALRESTEWICEHIRKSWPELDPEKFNLVANARNLLKDK